METLSTGKFHFESPSPFTSLDRLVGRGQSSVGGASMEWRRYFARRYVTFALPPIDGVGLKYVTSSPSNESMRVCVPPVKFGNVLPSILTVSTCVASSIEYVPKYAMMPCTIALVLFRRPTHAIIRSKFGQIGTHDRNRESTIGIRH